MPNIFKILRSIVPSSRPSGKTYGEPYVNFGDNQFGVFDSSNQPRDLLGAPIFSTARAYTAGLIVSYQGALYMALVNVAAGAWNPAQWSPLASQSQVNAIAAFTTGDVKLTMKTVADAGWVMMNDQGIGDASSGAANNGTGFQSLFTLLWTNIPNTWCPVTPGGRGATAAADWAAHKQLTLPKTLGRALAVAGAGPGLTGRSLGQILGEETHTNTIGEDAVHHHDSLPHYHDLTTHRHGYPTNGTLPWYNSSEPYITVDLGTMKNVLVYGGYLPPNSDVTQYSASMNTGGYGISTLDNGGGAPHNNMQPSSFLNIMIKL